MVASGTFGYGVEYAQLLDLNQLGAVVVKGIRLHPVRGNPRRAPPRSPAACSTPSACRGRAWTVSSKNTGRFSKN